MITANSWDDLLNIGTGLILKKIEPGSFEIKKDLIFEIRISGASWDGAIDYRGANFIIELQKAVNRIYEELYGEIVPLRSLNKLVTVKVRVVEGSSLFNIDLGEALSKMVGQMSSGEIILIAGITLATVAGYYTVRKVLDYKKEIKIHARQMERDETVDAHQKELLSKTIDKFTSTVDKALEVIEKKDLQAPARKLVSKLEHDDVISLPGNRDLTAFAAKEIYPRKPRVKSKSGIFDDTYIIRSIILEKTPIEFSLSIDDISLNAVAELPHADIERLSRKLEVAMKSSEDLVVPLQIFVLYGKRNIKSASITGLGDPRPNAERIAGIFDTN